MTKPATRYPLGVAVFCMNDSTPIVAAAEHDRVMGEIADELVVAGEAMSGQRRTIQRLSAENQRLRELLADQRREIERLKERVSSRNINLANATTELAALKAQRMTEEQEPRP